VAESDFHRVVLALDEADLDERRAAERDLAIVVAVLPRPPPAERQSS